jgi:hypothetical protein
MRAFELDDEIVHSQFFVIAEGLMTRRESDRLIASERRSCRALRLVAPSLPAVPPRPRKQFDFRHARIHSFDDFIEDFRFRVVL